VALYIRNAIAYLNPARAGPVWLELLVQAILTSGLYVSSLQKVRIRSMTITLEDKSYLDCEYVIPQYSVDGPGTTSYYCSHKVLSLSNLTTTFLIPISQLTSKTHYHNSLLQPTTTLSIRH
jgi:hypothetical protein